MTRSMWIPLIFGIVGVAILVSLGNWQVRRLAWKQGVLAEIEAQIGGDPVALPADPDPVKDRFLPVTAEGTLTGETALVLASIKQVGAIYRVISVLDTGTRRVLLDRGYRRVADQAGFSTDGPLQVTGNLHWPDETDSFTPDPEDKGGKPLYFARDVALLSAQFHTEPVLIVARDVTPVDPELTPFPVNTESIPNDHLVYAITWFLLAAVWAGMTLFLLWRMRR